MLSLRGREGETAEPPWAGGWVRLDGTLVLASRGQALSLTWALLLRLASISHYGRRRILFWLFWEGTLKEGRHSEAEKQKHSFHLSLPWSWLVTALRRLREEHILVKSKQINCPVEKLTLRQSSWCESIRKPWQICQRSAAENSLWARSRLKSLHLWGLVCSLTMCELHRGSNRLPHFTEKDAMAEKWSGFYEFTQGGLGLKSRFPTSLIPQLPHK